MWIWIQDQSADGTKLGSLSDNFMGSGAANHATETWSRERQVCQSNFSADPGRFGLLLDQ